MVRTTIDQFLVILGVIVIVVPVALLDRTGGVLITVLIGVCMVALGIWRLGHRILPERRVYIGLRSEVDDFLRLVRRMNKYGLDADTERMTEVKASMHDCIERMASNAGVLDMTEFLEGSGGGGGREGRGGGES